MDSYPSRNIVWPRRAVVTAGMPYGNKPVALRACWWRIRAR